MKKKKFLEDEKGNITLFFVFVVSTLLLLFIFVIIAPALQKFTTSVYVVGEKIVDSSQSDIQQIQNQEIRNDLNGILQQQLTSTADNAGLMGELYKNSFFIIVFIVAIILFLLSRSMVEVGASGGGYA